VCSKQRRGDWRVLWLEYYLYPPKLTLNFVTVLRENRAGTREFGARVLSCCRGHRFKRVVKEQGIKEIITAAMDQKNELGIKTPNDLIEQIRKMDGAVGSHLQAQMHQFRPKLVVNQIRSRDDIALGFSMRSSCSRYFGITIEYLGAIEFDDAVRQAARRRRPVMLDYPRSDAAKGIKSVASHLLKGSQMNVSGFLNSVPIPKPLVVRDSFLQ